MLLLPDNPEYGLACGLFAFIGNNSKKYFSWDKFTILGLFNDSRGGDACGRVCGDICEHGTGALDTYKKFNIATPHPRPKELPNVILGHCRKASSGGKDEIYAQPIVLRKRDLNMKSIKDTHLKKAIKELGDDTIIYSGIHNGTIDNYKELAPQYGISTVDHNDSKVLLTALFYGNYSILSEYIGTASLIWQNHINGKSFIFRGVSRYSNNSTIESEERPLHFFNIGEQNFYISSMPDALISIGAREKSVKEIKANTLIVFKDGVFVKETVVDRSKVTQGRYDYSISSKKHNNSRGSNLYYHREDDDVFLSDSFVAKHDCRQLPMWNGNTREKPINTKAGGLEHNPFIRYLDISKEPFRIQAETCDIYNSSVIKRAVFNKGRYWMQGNLMHGIYLLNAAGIVPNDSTRDKSILKPYYFVEGILLDGLTGYNKAIALHDEFMQFLTSDIADLSAYEQSFTSQAVKYSRFPTASLTNTIGEQDMLSCMLHDNVSDIHYGGTVNPLFSSRSYSFSNGDLVAITPGKDGIRMASHDERDLESSTAYLNVCKTNSDKSDSFKIGSQLYHLNGVTNPMSPLQNIMFGYFGLGDSDNIKVFFIHYLRDFCNNLRDTSCNMCTCKNTKSLSVCVVCKEAKSELNKLIKSVNYAAILQ